MQLRSQCVGTPGVYDTSTFEIVYVVQGKPVPDTRHMANAKNIYQEYM